MSKKCILKYIVNSIVYILYLFIYLYRNTALWYRTGSKCVVRRPQIGSLYNVGCQRTNSTGFTPHDQTSFLICICKVKKADDKTTV